MKKYKCIILLLLLFLNSFVAYCQKELEYAPYTKYLSAYDSDEFLISTKPITNREYLIYLLWNFEVYWANYPENLINASRE